MAAEYDVVLLPTFIQVETWRKRRAQSRPEGSFAQTATTFEAWVADLWELYGDGRALVGTVERAALMRLAFAQMAEEADAAGADGAGRGAGRCASGAAVALTLSPGVSQAAERCEREAAGVAEYEAAVAVAAEGGTPAGLSPREALFLMAIARYRALARERGLVEPGEACRLLARRAEEVFPRPLDVLVAQAAPPSWRMERFFAACPQLRVRVEPASGADGIRPPAEGVRVIPVRPSGRYAVAAAVMELLEGMGPGEQAVVSCVDPLALYRELEPALARRGLVGSVQGLAGFGDVDFGRAYLMALRAVRDGSWAPSDFADLLRSPFSGASPAQARAYDARLRGDRIVTRETCLAELRGQSAGLAALLALVEEGADEARLGRFERMAAELPHRSPVWRSQQLAAIDGLRAVSRFLDSSPARWRDTAAVLGRLSVGVSAAGLPAGADGARPDVLVTTQGAAAQLAPGSFSLLVAADLTASAYPLADRDDAAATLLGKLGLHAPEDALARARRTFQALVRVPSATLACLRPENDVDGNPAYPSAMLEELVDACRDARPGAPAAGVRTRGEEELYANARAEPGRSRQPVEARVAEPEPGDLAAPGADVLLLPRRDAAGASPLRRSPSPSQVELYLECPYKWFVSRRLGTATLEEGFGPLERGAFAHAALERFYRTFLAEGAGKVTEGNLPRARAVMRDSVRAVRREMRAQKPGSGRWVAASALEEREISQMGAQLLGFLDYERQVLPGFRPAYLEYSFSAEDAVEYAGRPMVGTVDRIDVDDAGRAVIVDYKGSVGPEHDIAGKTAADPGKVQTRIYAQMAGRALGLRVVGAIYLSYGRAHRLAGAVDPRELEAPHLPGARDGALSCALGRPPAPGAAGDDALPAFADLPFPDMLDATEELVADALARMEAADVAPRPVRPAVCQTCPAPACPARLAKEGM